MIKCLHDSLIKRKLLAKRMNEWASGECIRSQPSRAGPVHTAGVGCGSSTIFQAAGNNVTGMSEKKKKELWKTSLPSGVHSARTLAERNVVILRQRDGKWIPATHGRHNPPVAFGKTRHKDKQYAATKGKKRIGFLQAVQFACFLALLLE